MAQGDPPVYQLIDSSGNVQAEIRHNLAQSLIIDQLNGSDIDFQQSDLSNISSVSTELLSAERQSDIIHFAAEYAGSTADARLDNALAAADRGDQVRLETTNDYTNNRTISKRVRLVGQGFAGADTAFDADWTFSKRIHMSRVRASPSATLTINNSLCAIMQSATGGSITVNGDSFRYINNFGGDVTFASGTSGGIVDASTDVTVTDNGSNTIGDIA